MKYLVGFDETEHKCDRYKYDAIDYYLSDINWFAFSFVMTCLHSQSIYALRYKMKARGDEISEEDKLEVQSAITILSLVLAVRVFQLFFNSRLHNSDRERSYVSHSPSFYITIFCAYLIIVIIWYTIEGGHFVFA